KASVWSPANGSPRSITFHGSEMLNVIPLIERTVEHGNLVAEILRHEVHVRSLQTDLTIGDQLMTWSNTSRRKQSAQILGRQKDWLLCARDGLFPKDVVSSGKMSSGIAFFRT